MAASARSATAQAGMASGGIAFVTTASALSAQLNISMMCRGNPIPVLYTVVHVALNANGRKIVYKAYGAYHDTTLVVRCKHVMQLTSRL